MFRPKKKQNRLVKACPRLRRFETLEDRRMMAVVTGASEFDATLFGDILEGQFADEIMGYAYAVNYGGVDNVHSNDYGLSRTEADDPETNFHITTKIDVASVSKTITAVATLKLLEQQVQAADSPFSTLEEALEQPLTNFLPSDWDDLGDFVNWITIRQLLTHQSGLLEGDGEGNENGTDINFNTFSSSTFANIKLLLEADLPGPPDGSESYNNANYTILAKFVIPKLISPEADFREAGSKDLGFNFAQIDQELGQRYSDYVIENIFEPASIFAVSMDIDEGSTNNAKSYIDPDDDEPGSSMGDSLEIGGAFGWKLTARQLARFLNGVRHNDAILSPTARDAMDQGRLGWGGAPGGQAASTIARDYGQIYGHGGRLTGSENRRFRSEIVALPGDVEVAVVMNSNDNVLPGGNMEPSIYTAYLNAWTDVTFAGTNSDDVFEIRVENISGVETLEIWMSTDGGDSNLVFTHWLATLESLTIDGLDGSDQFIVDGLPEGVEFVLNGNAHADTFIVDNLAPNVLLTLNGDAGADVFSAGASSGNLELSNGVTFNGGADVDTVMLNDSINNNPFSHSHNYFISTDQMHRQGGAPGSIFDIDLYFSDVEHATLDTSLAPFDDFVEVLSTGWTTTINTYEGNDTVEVAGLTQSMDDVNGLILNTGDGTDSVTIYDQHSPWTGPQYQNYSVSETEVSRFAGTPAVAGVMIPVTVLMSGIESLDLFTSDSDDIVAIENMPLLAGTINTGEGDDTVVTTSGKLEDVDELVIVTGKGEDTVLLNDSLNPYSVSTANTYGVSTSRVHRDGTGKLPNHGLASDINVDYQGVEHLRLASGDLKDQVYISGGGAWTTDLFLGNGDDTVFASPFEQNIEYVDGLTVHGEQGKDKVILYDAHNTYSHAMSGHYEVSSEHVSRFRDVHGPGQTHLPQGTSLADAIDVLVQMDNVELLDLTTGGQSDDVEVISSTSGGTTLDTHNGDDTIVTTSGDLADVDGLVIESSVGNDTLILDDTSNPYRTKDAGNYRLELEEVRRGEDISAIIEGASLVRIEYANVENLQLQTGEREDHVEVSRGGTLTTEVRTGAGQDEILVVPQTKNLQLLPGLTVDGGADSDRIVLNDANNPYINNFGHIYTIDEQHVSRDSGVLLQPLTPVPVTITYANMEVIELETGTESEIVNIGGTGSEAALTVRGNNGADRLNILGDVFAEIDIYGGNPTHAPGDVLSLMAPADAVTGLVPSTTEYGAGQAMINETLISYWEIETIDSALPTPKIENDFFGDFDGNGIVNRDDLTHPLLGYYARYGDGLSGRHFMAWQQNQGQKTPYFSHEKISLLGNGFSTLTTFDGLLTQESSTLPALGEEGQFFRLALQKLQVQVEAPAPAKSRSNAIYVDFTFDQFANEPASSDHDETEVITRQRPQTQNSIERTSPSQEAIVYDLALTALHEEFQGLNGSLE